MHISISSWLTIFLVIGTQNLKINRQEAALVFEVIFQSLRKVFEKLKNWKIVDKEFFNLIDIAVTMMIDKLRYVPELCQHLAVLFYDIKIHNNQKAIDNNFYESFELEVWLVYKINIINNNFISF